MTEVSNIFYQVIMKFITLFSLPYPYSSFGILQSKFLEPCWALSDLS